MNHQLKTIIHIYLYRINLSRKNQVLDEACESSFDEILEKA